MKKLLVLAMCAALAFTLAACGRSSSGTEEEAQEDEPEYETATYKGMTFSYPVDATYEESDDIGSITLGDSDALIMFMSVDLSESDEEYNEAAAEPLLEAAVQSAIDAYDDVQDQTIENLTIAGCSAIEESAQVTAGDALTNIDCTAIYDEAGQYIYMIEYGARDDLEGRLDDYQALLDSISFEDEDAEEDADAE